MEEGVIYSYLGIPAGSLPNSSSTPARHHTCPQCPPWHRIALRLGWAGNGILLGVVVALLALLVFQNPQPGAVMPMATKKNTSQEIHRNATVCSHSLEEWRRSRSLGDFLACLKQNLCEMEMSTAEGSRCRICPRHWLPHRDKCYWLSKDLKYWNMSHEDCSRRKSDLLMIQDQEEMEFIWNITQHKPAWIGLNIAFPSRNWTWVDGSLFNQTLFTVVGPADEKSCAAIHRNQIQSENCNTHYHWICQKEGLLI